ncbi:MAG: TetR family transcriptional regulator [Anaerolineae bacterium]|nr:MAG: TetR family transcriptional regulator [Anaerolineae bacterium]
MGNSTPYRRTQTERTRASREKILQAAIEFFSKNGFRGAKLADIAQAAGLTEPGLLHHFPSKTHLLMQVLDERDRIDKQRVQMILQQEGNHVLEAFQDIVNHNATVPGLVQLFTVLVAESLVAEHPAHAFFVQRYQRTRASLVESIRKAQQAGEIRADLKAEDLAILMTAIMDGLQVQWLLEPETMDMRQAFGVFLNLLKAK